MTEKKWQPVTPLLTVDVVLRVNDGIVLIKRKYPPFGWALPGGFVEVGETVEKGAVREVAEETGLIASNLWLIGVYSDPERDKRFHTVSVVFGATATGSPVGADDAKQAKIFKSDDFPVNIVFDHKKIIDDFLRLERNS